jgi:hypothetical protein
LYFFAEFFAMTQLSIHFLFRIGDMLFGRREGRFATLKALEEARRVKREDIEALCKIMLVAQALPEEIPEC